MAFLVAWRWLLSGCLYLIRTNLYAMKGWGVSNVQGMPIQKNSKASDQKFCHACAAIIHISASMCPKCGAQQQSGASGNMGFGVVSFEKEDPSQRNISDMRYCRGCGGAIHSSASTCPRCGAKQFGDAGVGAVNSGATKSRVAAALLAFFLGGLGVHKFYCGKIGVGFIYLVFFWTWIPALIALVEGVVFLANTNSDEEFTRKYCI